MRFLLKVHKKLELIKCLINVANCNAVLSFEGFFSSIPVPKCNYDFSLGESASYINGKEVFTSVWSFSMDTDTKFYLINNLLNRIGISSNVIHVQLKFEEKNIFSSYDNFNDGCVFIEQTQEFTIDFLKDLKDKKIIWDFEVE